MTGGLGSGTEALAAALQDRYRIERELGRGGMATVYVAEDIRHHRRVAIKVLRPELAAVVGAERFLREIRTTATLQHSHILGLIDSGEVGGLPYYVMPFVDGESLRDRLTRERQLPVTEAVRIATEVASALDYAHRHGVVHRDIKPENILLQDGNALVADFGIAVAVSSAGGSRLTESGVAVGTPRYMSPEQAAGEREIDARTDIFTLGAVTYEMLVGQPPFSGPTLQATIARVLSENPRALTIQRRSIPPAVEAAVIKALEKLPADRFASARDFAAALSASDATAAPAHVLGRRRWVPFAALGSLTIAGVAAGWAVGQRTREVSESNYPPSRLAIVTSRVGGTGWVAAQRQLAITPDGTTLLYVTIGADGRNTLVRQALDAVEPTPITGVRPGTAGPIISADGRSFIGWVAGERTAYRYPVAGGPGTPLSFIGGYTEHAEWDASGSIWYSPREGGGLFRLDPGDSVARLASPGTQNLRLQQILPGGRHALVVSRATAQSAPVVLLDVAKGTTTPLLATPVSETRYAGGYLIYVLPTGTLQAAPFDVETGKITGAAVTIGTNVSVTGLGAAQISVAPNGTIAYIVEELQSLAFIDRTGTARATLETRHNYHAPRFSPDGRRVAVDFNSGDGRDVWIVTVGDNSLSRATFDRDGHDAVWSPDGRSITYTSARTGTEGIYRKRPGGSEQPESLYASHKIGFTGMWLRDGSALVSAANDLGQRTAADIGLVPNGGHGPLEPFVATEYTEAFPALSPDSRWVAYTSDQSGRSEVYVRPLRGPGDAVQISLGGGTEAVWGPTGREIFYRTLTDSEPRLAVANVHSEPSFAVESRQSLFSITDVVTANPHANYDISPDGKTFVMVRRTPATRIMVIQNLPALVRRLQGP